MSKKSLVAIMIGVVLVGIGIVGYFQYKTPKIHRQAQPQTSKLQPVKTDYNTKTDEDITQVLQKEKDVVFANVATHPQIIFAVVALKNKPTEVYAQSLLDKYYPQLLKKYPNIQLVMHIKNHDTGKILASKEVSPKQ